MSSLYLPPSQTHTVLVLFCQQDSLLLNCRQCSYATGFVTDTFKACYKSLSASYESAPGLASSPGLRGGGGRKGWYILHAHASSLFRFLIIHWAVCTRPSFPLPLKGLGTRLPQSRSGDLNLSPTLYSANQRPPLPIPSCPNRTPLTCDSQTHTDRLYRTSSVPMASDLYVKISA